MPELVVKVIACPPLDNRCYVLWRKGQTDALVIDPSMAFDEIMQLSSENHLQVKLVVNTHGHHDHMFHNHELVQASGAKLCIHELDSYRLEKNSKETRPWLPRPPAYQKQDFVFREGSVLEAGGVKLSVLHTPGHTEGSCCFLVDGVLFTGDTLFKGTFGRTDFPGGNEGQMRESLARLSKLDGKLRVLPGHGQETTLQDELAWMEKLLH